jgi:hypothetical protein
MRDFTEAELGWLAERSTAMHAEMDAIQDDDARAAIRARHDEANASAFSQTFDPVAPQDISAHVYWGELVRRDPGIVHCWLEAFSLAGDGHE